MARLSLLKRPRHLAAAIAANPGTGNQTIKRPVGFFAMTGIGKLGYHSVLEIGGPDNLTFNQLAAAIQAAAGRTGTPRHIPPLALRLMAGTVGHR